MINSTIKSNNKKEIILNIADFYLKLIFYNHPVIEKYTLRKDIIKYCSDFIVRKDVKTSNCDYLMEFVSVGRVEKIEIKQKFYYPLYRFINKKNILISSSVSYLQFLNILWRLLLKLLTSRGGFIVHSSAVVKNDKVLVFLGKSGGGKSTIIDLLKERYSPFVDDILLIKKSGNDYFCYQTPFIEKRKFIIKNGQKKYPLGSIYFLSKSLSIKLKKEDELSKFIKKFTHQIFLDKSLYKKQINNSIFLFKKIKRVYTLYFSKKNKRQLIDMLRDQEDKDY